LLDLKSPLILGAAPAGLAVACAGWLLLAGGGPGAKPLDAAEARLARLPPAVRSAATAPTATASGVGAELFTITAPPPVRLDGVSRTRRRAAALLAFGSHPAQWVSLGATIEGVTLVEVADARVTLETVVGRQELGLGESTSGAPAEPATSATPDPR